MTPPHLRQAFQSGLITRQQMQTSVIAQQAAQDQAAAAAAQMKAGAAKFLQDNKIPVLAPGQKTDPAAQSVVDLTARAADLRNKIQTAFDTGGADGLKDLAAHREALDAAESGL